MASVPRTEHASDLGDPAAWTGGAAGLGQPRTYEAYDLVPSRAVQWQAVMGDGSVLAHEMVQEVVWRDGDVSGLESVAGRAWKPGEAICVGCRDATFKQAARRWTHPVELIERLLCDAAARCEPWTLISEAGRLKVGFLRWLPAKPSVEGWVFELPQRTYGAALTVGGRIFLMSYNAGNEKHSGRVDALLELREPCRGWPHASGLQHLDGALRSAGAEHFGSAVAGALVSGEKWHTPMGGRNGYGEDAADFVRSIPVTADFPQRRPGEI